MKFEVEIDKRKLNAYLKALQISDVEACIKVDSTAGLSALVVDPAHVMLVEAVLEKHAFERYNVEAGNLGIDLEKITGSLKHMNNTIKLKQTESGQLSISSEKIERRMALTSTENMSHPKKPSLTAKASFKIKHADVKQILKANRTVADCIKIAMDADGITMQGSEDTDSVEMHIPKAELINHSMNNEEEKIEAMFQMGDIQKIFDVIKTDEIEIQMVGVDHPAIFCWELPNDSGNAIAMVAPWLDN